MSTDKEVKCALCNGPAAYPAHHFSGKHVSEEDEAEEVEVKIEIVPKVTITLSEIHFNIRYWDGGGAGQSFEIHMCGNCFRDRLIPWVNGFGNVVIEGRDWDW